MPTKTTKKTNTTNNQLVYQSNPFSLSFNKFGQLFEKNLGWAIALIILPLFGFFFQLLGSLADIATSPEVQAHPGHSHASDGTVVLATVLGVSVVTILVSTIIVAVVAVQTFITGLFTYVSLENDAGRTARFSTAVDAVVARFWRLFLAQLLASVKIFGWTLLFIIPGIIATFRFMLLPYVIMDQPASKKGVKDSHDRVKTLVAGRKREVFGVATVGAIIPLVGTMAQLIGNAALYNQLKVYTDKKLEKPPVHWLNYFGFILIAVYLLLLLFIITLAIIAASN